MILNLIFVVLKKYLNFCPEFSFKNYDCKGYLSFLVDYSENSTNKEMTKCRKNITGKFILEKDF